MVRVDNISSDVSVGNPNRFPRDGRVAGIMMNSAIIWSIRVCFLACVFLPVSRSVLAADADPRPAAKRPFRENATLPVDSNLLKQFSAVEDILAENRWADAISLLQEIAQSENRSLVLAQPGVAEGEAIYLNVATRCSVLLSRIPEEGRTVYRRRVDSQAKRSFENWQRTRDVAELLKIVRQTFLSSYGDDALLALGEYAWDRGEYSTARSWWEQMIPIPDEVNPRNYPTVLRYPDSDIDRASILARIILCSIMENESVRAADELQQFAEKYPQAEGRLAGQSGQYVQILQRLLDESKSWNRTEPAAEVATFALSSQRYQRISESIDIGAPRWNRPLPVDPTNTHDSKRPFPFTPLCYHPVVYDNIVFVNDSNSIHAWNVLSGEPVWKSEGPDPAVIYPTVPDDTSVAYKQTSVGEPHYTMTIADNRLFACMGSPVTCPAIREFVPASDLICLDLTREGKLVWKTSAHELLPDAVPWRFEGTPIVVNGRAYMALCRRSPLLEITVVCLDADDGELIWTRPVGSFRVSVDENFNRVSHLLLTAGAGRLFLSTDVGEMIALNQADGRPDWAVTYESRPQDPNDVLGERPQGTVPPLFYEGMLFVAPQDGNAAYCIEANSGRIRWKHTYIRNLPVGLPESQRRERELMQLAGRQWHHLLGIAPGGLMGRLIVSGNALWSFDIETGNLVWTQSAGQFSRKGNSAFGRGLIASDQILIPMRESIEVFDLKTGNRTRSAPLKNPDSNEMGGNLTLASGTLLVAQPNRLVAYGQYSRLKQRIERKVIQRPNETSLQIQLADLEASEGLFEAAIEQYETLLKQFDETSSDARSVRSKLGGLYHKLGSIKFQDSELDAALEFWSKAIPLVSDVAESVDLKFELADAELGLDRPEAALRPLQQILNDQRLGAIRRESSTAHDAAAREISRLIAEHGRSIYREVETTATAELAALEKSADRTGLRQFVNRYPQAEAATRAREKLAKLSRDAGEKSEAFAMFNDIRTTTNNDQTSVNATFAMIEMLEAGGREDWTLPLWKLLGERSSPKEVVFSGSTQDLSDLVQKKKSQFTSHSQDEVHLNFLERTWTLNLPADCQILIPAHQSPTEGLVLTCSKETGQTDGWNWSCIDWKTGKVRWTVVESSSIDVVGITPFHLLIGTSQGWTARAIDDGRSVWNWRSPNKSQVVLIEMPTDANWVPVMPAAFDIDRGLQLLDPDDGRVVTILKPSGYLRRMIGHDQRAELASATGDGIDVGVLASVRSNSDEAPFKVIHVSDLYLETIKPNRLWKIQPPQAPNGWWLDDCQNVLESWLATPFVVNKRLIGISNIRHLIGQQLGSAFDSKKNRWAFRNLPFGSADPVTFLHNDKLMVVADGNQLMSFDASTGNRLWTAGLTDIPMERPAHQICACNQNILATSRGVLRSISVIDGRSEFAEYLGDTSPQWRTVNVWDQPGHSHDGSSSIDRKTFVAAWPLYPPNPDPLPSAIRICDGQSGRALQRIPVDSTPQGIALNPNGFGIVWTEKSLSGIRFSQTSATVVPRHDAISR